MSDVTCTVVVPVHNRSDVVARAVESLLEQDWTEPYEVVVVDDGSTDDSAFRSQDVSQAVRVVRQPRQGAAAARHRGIREARGDVIAFLDSDDVAKPFHLRCLWDALNVSKDVVLSCARCEHLGGEPFHAYVPPRRDAYGIVPDPLLELLRIGNFTRSMNLMVRRAPALELSAGRNRYEAANDFDLVLRLATRGLFAFVDRVTIACERRRDGTPPTLQVAFALIAMQEAVSFAGRREADVERALGENFERLWLSTVARLMVARRWDIAWEVTRRAVRCARLIPTLRQARWHFSR